MISVPLRGAGNSPRRAPSPRSSPRTRTSKAPSQPQRAPPSTSGALRRAGSPDRARLWTRGGGLPTATYTRCQLNCASQVWHINKKKGQKHAETKISQADERPHPSPTASSTHRISGSPRRSPERGDDPDDARPALGRRDDRPFVISGGLRSAPSVPGASVRWPRPRSSGSSTSSPPAGSQRLERSGPKKDC